MNSKDLKNFRYDYEKIKIKIIQIKEIKEQLYNITGNISDMPKAKSVVQDKFADKLAEWIDLEEEYLELAIKQRKKQIEIMDQLEKVDQPYQNILYKKYIKGERLVKIADDLGYEYGYLRKINSKALLKFEEAGKYKT
jgi:hypothetical protein